MEIKCNTKIIFKANNFIGRDVNSKIKINFIIIFLLKIKKWKIYVTQK